MKDLSQSEMQEVDVITGQAVKPGAGGTSPGPDRVSAQSRTSEVGDAAAGVATTVTVSVGDQFDGSIGSGGDRDWLAVTLEAGKSYVFMVWGRGGAGGLANPNVTLRDGLGGFLTSNDNASAGNQFSLLQFTATTSGVYYLDVGGAGAGAYRVQVATNVFTAEEAGAYISEFEWGLTAPLRFGTSPGGAAITYNVSALTAQGQQLAHWAFEMWSQTTGLRFQSTAGAAQITLDDNPGGPVAGPSSFNPTTMVMNSSTVNISTSWLATHGTSIDSFSFMTYLHEIGHALGLGHAGDYEVSTQYPAGAFYINDSYQLSLMSYHSVRENTYVDGADGFPATPMPADLVAMSLGYGSLQAFAGDSVWGAQNNLGGLMGQLWSIWSREASNPALVAGSGVPTLRTINDTGGIDTLDLSFATVGQRIDLTPGSLSDMDGLQNNLAISTFTVIENVVTGAGADRITGNAANNRIRSGGGNDTVDGGAGTDTAIIGVDRASITFTTVGDMVRITSADGVDDFVSVEFFQFNDQTISLSQLLTGAGGPTPISGGPGPDALNGTPEGDSILGDGGGDNISAGAGNDTIRGGADADFIIADVGDDLVYGDDGNDQVFSGEGNDTIRGGLGDDNIGAQAGHDSVLGEDGNDSLGGGFGNDSMYGGLGNDVIGSGPNDDILYGDDGDDTLSGEWGRDTLYGGDGNENIAGSFDTDLIYAGAGIDTIGGGTGNDTIWCGTGNDNVGAGDDADLVYGEAGDDFLAGGLGNDSLYGGDGNDTLNGNAGNDLLSGGLGRDLFVFREIAAGEVDRIAAWENGQDILRFHNVAGASNAQRFAQFSITSVSGGVAVTYQGHQIILEGATIGQVDVTDFLFV